MELRDRRILSKIRDEAQLISKFIYGIDYNTFMQNEIIRRAVNMTLSNIGKSSLILKIQPMNFNLI